jgi:hypothetical protein
MTKRAAVPLLLALAMLLTPAGLRGAGSTLQAGDGPMRMVLPLISKHVPDPPPPAGCPFGGRATDQGPAALAAALRTRPGTYYQVIDYADSQYFAQLPNHIRALRAESLDDLRATAQRALNDGLEYEALVYDLEGWDQTPIWEQEHQVEATQMARDIVHSFDKIFVMAPARALTWRNWPEMAPYADMWVIQAQAGQRNYAAGPQFANWLAPYVHSLDTHPGMPIWAQLTTYPERALTMNEYFDYVNSVYPSLVDGIYVFNPSQRLPWADVFNRACP